MVLGAGKEHRPSHCCGSGASTWNSVLVEQMERQPPAPPGMARPGRPGPGRGRPQPPPRAPQAVLEPSGQMGRTVSFRTWEAVAIEPGALIVRRGPQCRQSLVCLQGDSPSVCSPPPPRPPSSSSAQQGSLQLLAGTLVTSVLSAPGPQNPRDLKLTYDSLMVLLSFFQACWSLPGQQQEPPHGWW